MRYIVLLLIYYLLSTPVFSQTERTFVTYDVEVDKLFISVVNSRGEDNREFDLDFPLTSWVDSFIHQGIAGYYGLAISQRQPSLYRASLQTIERYGVALYEKLILPVEDQLLGDVVFITDDVLTELPFEVLLSKPPVKSEFFESYDFLLKRFRISYAYSRTMQQFMEDWDYPAAENSGVLGFAPFAEYEGAMVIGLPSSGKELQKVIEVTGGKGFYGTAATINSFYANASSYRQLHLATHASADIEYGSLSYLWFRKEGEGDGTEKLYAEQIKRRNLRFDLVVLSSCESGAGQYLRGEQLFSVGSAFAEAGAKSVLMALWPVDDQATLALILEFYQNLKAGLAKDAALQQAKLSFLSDAVYGHPYFWSSFLGFGDMRSLY